MTRHSAQATLLLIELGFDLKLSGAVAQLGERMTGSHEVRGSIPLGSTNICKHLGPLGAVVLIRLGLLTAILTATH